MPRRPGDWLRQARADLESARALRSAGRYEGCAFFAHQAAEKAIKALWEARGVEARGHALSGLTEPLESVPPEVSDAARRLDRHYVGARYPNTLPEGAPADAYTELDAEQALRDAATYLAHVEGRLSDA
jgi:HEPN domain-containing protein